MKQHIFKGRVIHNKKEFIKGQACPDDILKDMQDKGLVEPLPEAVKAIEPVEPPQSDRSPKFQEKK